MFVTPLQSSRIALLTWWVTDASYDGLESDDEITRLGQRGAIQQGPFPLAQYFVI